MVNYVLSFCRITSASRIFSRNFYLPLLKPQTPKDALRTYRITGRWLLGAKIQHYIPVLLNHRKKRSKRESNFGKKIHKEDEDYTYMTPLFDLDNENHQLLQTILDNKQCDNRNFVYTVDDKKYNIVIQGELEKAILDGDVIDVLVSQQTDKIIVKLNTMKKIALEIQYYDDDMQLYCGEGATSPADEKFHHHGKYTMSLAKIFEDKELAEERWEEELRRLMRRKRKQKKEGSKEWKAMMEESIKNLDWQKFETDARRIIDEIDEPIVEQEIDMQISNLESTQNVNDLFVQRLDMLPTLNEIPDIIKGMGEATLGEMQVQDGEGTRSVSGVTVTLPSGKECFVSGQMVKTEDGDVFVPGQTIQNEFGLEYSPGITIAVDNKPTLISGLIMGEEERDPMFLPTESTITSSGQLTFATTEAERPKVLPEKPKPETVPEIEPEVVIETQSETSEDLSSIELNTLEMDEIDTSINQRLELEKLKAILRDDGLDDLLLSIDAKRRLLQLKLDELKKLSMSSKNDLVSYVSESDALEIAATIVADDKDTQNRLADIFVTMTRRLVNFRNKNSLNAENIKSSSRNAIKTMLKTAFIAAAEVFKNRPKDQCLALNTIGEIIGDVLRNNSETVDELLELMNTPQRRLETCDTILKQLTIDLTNNPVNFLGQILNGSCDALESVQKILEKDSEIKCEAFVKVAKVENGLVELLVDHLTNGFSTVKTESDALELLEQSITAGIRQLLQNKRQTIDVSSLKAEALGFARALGVKKIEEALECGDFEEIPEFVERILLIRLLSQRDYSLKSAIERVQKNPERARSDPRIRQLIRESGVLLSVSSGLKTSREIPFQLLKSQNLLAIEDVLVQKSKLPLPVMVTREDLQAVIPREASKGVLEGRVPYMLVNENGVLRMNFEGRNVRRGFSSREVA